MEEKKLDRIIDLVLEYAKAAPPMRSKKPAETYTIYIDDYERYEIKRQIKNILEEEKKR